jgi:hypothetical protein
VANIELGLMPFRSDARWSAAATPADRTVCARSSIVSARSATAAAGQLIALCDADLGFSELNALIAGTAAQALRTALSALHNPSSPTVLMRMAVEHALRSARRQRTRLTGYVPPQGLETDGLSVLAAAGFGERLVVASVGACRLWIWRAGLLYPLIHHGNAELVISERAFLPGDRVLLATPVITDALSDAQIATLCHRQPDERLLVHELVRRSDAADMAGLRACAIMTREVSHAPVMVRSVTQQPVPAAPQAAVGQTAPERAVVRRSAPVVASKRAHGMWRASEASLSMLGLVAMACITLGAMIAMFVLTQQNATTVAASTQPRVATAAFVAPRQSGVLVPPITPTTDSSASALRSQAPDAASASSASSAVSAPTSISQATRTPVAATPTAAFTAAPTATSTAIPASTPTASVTPAHSATPAASPTAVYVADALPTLTTEPFATAIPVPQP